MTEPRLDKFTDRARKAIQLATDESRDMNHNYVGTEHLLLGLLDEGEGVAARILENLNVEPNKVRLAVEFIIGRGDRPVMTDQIGLTPRASRVLVLAIEEVKRLGHNYIGTEHLLLGLVAEGEGIAAGVLESIGVNLEVVRREVINVLSESAKASSKAIPPLQMATPDPDACTHEHVALDRALRTAFCLDCEQDRLDLFTVLEAVVSRGNA